MQSSLRVCFCCVHLRHYFFHTELVHALLCCGLVAAFSFPQVQLWLSSIVNDVTSWRGCNQRAAGAQPSSSAMHCIYMHQTGAAAVSARIKCTLGCTDEFAYKYWGREAEPAACTHCIFWQRLPSCQTRFLYMCTPGASLKKNMQRGDEFSNRKEFVCCGGGRGRTSERRFDKSATRLLCALS